jgi:hypothetical protein
LKKSFRFLVAVALLALSSHCAMAGAPLKGVDVKLGKNPGGGCAARTTDASGKANFGVWPKGNYTLTLSPASTPELSVQNTARTESAPSKPSTLAPVRMHLTLMGAVGGKIERDVESAAASARQAPLEFSLGGKEELIVVVTALP